MLGRKGGKGTKEMTPKDAAKASTSSSIDSPPTSILVGSAQQNILDPNHWSKEEKYDADTFLEHNYKKHLARHANKWVFCCCDDGSMKRQRHTSCFERKIYIDILFTYLFLCVCLFFRVLLRVRMLYYIKHEIIGDLVQQINDGVKAR